MSLHNHCAQGADFTKTLPIMVGVVSLGLACGCEVAEWVGRVAAKVTVKVTASVMASVTVRRTREREAPVFYYNLCPDIDYDLAGVFKIYCI